MRNSLILLATLIVCSAARGQAQSNSAGSTDSSMPGMDMSGSHHDMSNLRDVPKAADREDGEAGTHVMHAMEGHMETGAAHMRMTELRRSRPGDADRAQKVVEAARKAAEKYEDYHVALAGGFKIFLPNVLQKMYHFTNYAYAMEAAFYFNPEHPTSLLYEKHGEDYRLIGVMYTAPKRFTQDQLDERIPLSVAQWHEHVNFCMPPAGRRNEMLQPHPQFGLRGSIVTEEACDAAGGTFHPVVFNWMVHVYPSEKDPAKIWSIERQHND